MHEPIVTAIPDALAVRAVVAYARRVNPTLDIVVRTHSQTEQEFLARYGVTDSVLGELELAREMTRYALRHLDGDASGAPDVGRGLRDLGRAWGGGRCAREAAAAAHILHADVST